MVARNFRLEEFVRSLERWGIADILLPFLLVFVIVYAILQKTHILGQDKKNLNVIVGIVTGLMVVIPHATGTFRQNVDPVIIINEALPQVSVVLVAVVFLLVLIGVFGQDYIFLGVSAPGWIAFFSLITIIFIFGSAAGWWYGNFGPNLEQFFGTEGIAVAIMLLVFGIVIAWITSESKEREDRTILNRLGIDFSKLFGKK